jgi:hypothetical protein
MLVQRLFWASLMLVRISYPPEERPPAGGTDGHSHRRTTVTSVDPRTGLPLVNVGTVVTSEDVRALEDQE